MAGAGGTNRSQQEETNSTRETTWSWQEGMNNAHETNRGVDVMTGPRKKSKNWHKRGNTGISIPSFQHHVQHNSRQGQQLHAHPGMDW
jgi:hypothetical protein